MGQIKRALLQGDKSGRCQQPVSPPPPSAHKDSISSYNGEYQI